MHVLAHPPQSMNISPCLDGNIVLDGEQIQGPEKFCIICALEIFPYPGTEPTQHICHEWRTAKQCAQRSQHRLFQPPDTPDAKVHPAPLGVYARCNLVPVYMSTHEELDQHHPEQVRERVHKGNQVSQESNGNELPKESGHEELANFVKGNKREKAYDRWRIEQCQKQHLQGGEKTG